MKLLVVDDEPMICYSFKKVFTREDVEVLTAGTLAEARQRVQADSPDVIVLDLQLPDGSGLTFFEQIVALDPKRPVIFITAHGTTDTAIEAMKNGAFDYLIKPIDLEKVTSLLERAFDAVRRMRVPAELPDDPGSDRIIGRSPVMQEMCKTIGRVAAQGVNVLILGESGTGKELVARAIYQHSRRASKPFLAINCAAIPESLVESELFGHEIGTFTGAVKQRIGKFEQCDGGTILLDEIGDMPMSAQSKILRLLQEQKFERVGGNRVLSTDVRILAATNQNLEHLIVEGKFRNDLYYRLKGVTIHVPALRDRKHDIPELAHHFLYTYGRELNLDVRGFAPEVMEKFQAYHWPGNVRELQGVVKQAILRTSGQMILPEFLGEDFQHGSVALASRPATEGPSSELDLARQIETCLQDGKKNVHARIMQVVERELLTRALRATRGHQAQASELLGINRTTLRSKLRELGISLEKVLTDSSEGD
jgi:two-component system nitrogen regulation response regulator GlnG